MHETVSPQTAHSAMETNIKRHNNTRNKISGDILKERYHHLQRQTERYQKQESGREMGLGLGLGGYEGLKSASYLKHVTYEHPPQVDG